MRVAGGVTLLGAKLSCMAGWSEYYEAAGEAPRSTLLRALDGFVAPGFAVDLGCGTGRDTAELVKRGWRVLAIDAEREGIERLNARGLANVEAVVASFDSAEWPETDLVNSSYALPFCAPERFFGVWARVVSSLRPGGRFCGQLFGDRDGWRSEKGMTFLTRLEAKRLFRTLELELFEEVEEDGTTATGTPKHWHLFHVIARK